MTTVPTWPPTRRGRLATRAPAPASGGVGPLRPFLRCGRGAGLSPRRADAEVHVLDAGHFALDEKVDEVAGLIRTFLARTLVRTPEQ